MPEKILVVDDDTDSLKLIGLTLQRQGFEIVAANTGKQAMEKALSDRPDLVILDVMMPDMDGTEVCRQLRTNPATKAISIIMFSAKAMVDDKVAGFEAGADDYLTKPTHPAELVSRVKAILARRPAAAQTTATASSGGLVIGLIGAKGGVGLTTLAANIAASLSGRGSTILTDFRLGQGTLGLTLGAAKSSGLANVLGKPPTELNRAAVEQELVAHTTGLRLLLSSARPKEANLVANPDTLAAVLKYLRALGKFVVVDLGSGLSRQNARLIKELDHMVMVVEPYRAVLLMARELLKEMEGLGASAGKTSVVLVNRAPSTLQIPWQEAEQLMNREMLAIISPAPELCFQAAEAGLPLVNFQPGAVISGQMSKLAEELGSRGRMGGMGLSQ
jgi:pilus assembly protein CpaE